MFAFEAAGLLKNVVCPFCKRDARFGLGSPFRKFDAMELRGKCGRQQCKNFFEELGARFKAYENGHITELALQEWLDEYRTSPGPSEGGGR